MTSIPGIHCPACGQALPSCTITMAQLRELRLGPVQTSVVRLLADAYPSRISRDVLFDKIYGYSDSPANIGVAISKAVRTASAKLAPFGWQIRNDMRGRGMIAEYYLVKSQLPSETLKDD